MDDAVRTFEFHRDVLLAFIDYLDPKPDPAGCQDWGGLLGLPLPMSRPGRESGPAPV